MPHISHDLLLLPPLPPAASCSHITCYVLTFGGDLPLPQIAGARVDVLKGEPSAAVNKLQAALDIDGRLGYVGECCRRGQQGPTTP